MSRDLTDIILLVDGRDELVAEVQQAPPELRAYLSEELTGLMEEPRFLDGVFRGALRRRREPNGPLPANSIFEVDIHTPGRYVDK